LFGDAFKRILFVLLVLALLGGAALGVLFALPRNEPVSTQAVNMPDAVPSESPATEAEATPEPSATAEPVPVTPEEWVSRYLATMSTEEKLGQLVMFGFTGTSDVTATFRDLWEPYQVGNAVLYGSNIKSDNSDGGFDLCATLTKKIDERMTTSIPPLVAIDVEGGSVVRFRWRPQPVSARSLGRRRDVDYAFEQFQTIGSKLVSVGINVDLAPVLDVSENPMDTFLETRIISEDASITAAIGGAVVDGLQAGGCLSAAKHFPGHGTVEDSHAVTPQVDKTAEEIASYDLVPFESAIASGVDAIMVAHVFYPALDSTDIASMSQPIITGLLREKMGFTGLVISDDFRMEGLTQRYEIADAAVRFLLAGGDIVMCGAENEKQQAILEGLTAAAADGRLTSQRIDESVTRILLKKLSLGNWDIQTQLAERLASN
jgi:beta-N-acetylhexosaminidase